MGHPDFRVGGRVFATLGYPNADSGMVKLSPEQQDALAHSEPEVYAPVKGGWGRGGATTVNLRKASAASLRRALNLAWEHTARRPLSAKPSPRKRQAPGRRSRP